MLCRYRHIHRECSLYRCLSGPPTLRLRCREQEYFSARSRLCPPQTRRRDRSVHEPTVASLSRHRRTHTPRFSLSDQLRLVLILYNFYESIANLLEFGKSSEVVEQTLYDVLENFEYTSERLSHHFLRSGSSGSRIVIDGCSVYSSWYS